MKLPTRVDEAFGTGSTIICCVCDVHTYDTVPNIGGAYVCCLILHTYMTYVSLGSPIWHLHVCTSAYHTYIPGI